MNNFDRFLRVIYKDANLSELGIWPSSRASLEDHLREHFFISSDVLSADRTPTGRKPSQTIIESFLRAYHHEYSEDEARIFLADISQKLFREFAQSEASPINTAFMLLFCAHEILECVESQLRVKQGSLLEWNGLINKIDSTVFVGAHMAQDASGAERGSDFVGYNDENLDHILAKGYSDNHMHLNGSGYTAEISWYVLMNGIFSDRDKCAKGVSRIVDAGWGYLNRQNKDDIELVFMKMPMLRNYLILSAYNLRMGNDERVQELADNIQAIFQACDDLTVKRLCASDKMVADQYEVIAAWKELTKASQVKKYDDLFLDDPSDYLHDEQLFFCVMFEMLLKGKLSGLFLYAFNVYIAAITQFKLTIMQDNMIMGFEEFKKAESQKDALIKSFGPTGIEAVHKSVFHKYYSEPGVRQVELRIAPPRCKEGIRKGLVKTIDQLRRANDEVFCNFQKKASSDIKKIKFGIIVHFIKDGKIGSLEKGVARKGDFFDRIRKEYEGIVRFFEMDDQEDNYLKTILGIDAANYEKGTRPEVFGPVFREFTREISSQHCTGLTYHVGEDFLTLCSGVRAIDEAVDFLELRKGDRIGHATALGLCPDAYFKRKRDYITTTLQDHVDDLAWLHRKISERHPKESDILVYLQREFLVYFRELFDPLFQDAHDDVTNRIEAELVNQSIIGPYEASMRLRGNNPKIYERDDLDPRQRYASAAEVSSEASDSMLAKDLYGIYQYSDVVKRRGIRAVVAQADSRYIKAVKLAQKCLRTKMIDLGVSIEANPSSNRKISYVDRYIDLHILRLNQSGLSLPKEFTPSTENANISITINTDDSGVFQTHLATEYAYMLEAMMREEFEKSESYQYIDELREASFAQSFIDRTDG